MKLSTPAQEFLATIVQQFPKTPYKGAKAINEYQRKNFRYGFDENIMQGLFVREPHEIQHMMTCQESGILNYLLARANHLDVILLKMNNMDNIGQSHLVSLIQGSQNNYVLTNTELGTIKELTNSKLLVEEQLPFFTTTFDSLEIVDEEEIDELLKKGREKEYFRNFFQTSQQSSTYYGYSDKDILFYANNKTFELDGDHLNIRMSTNYPGFYIHEISEKNNFKIVYSTGMHNKKLFNAIPILDFQRERTDRLIVQEPETNENMFRRYSLSAYGSYVTLRAIEEGLEQGKKLSPGNIPFHNTLTPKQKDAASRFSLAEQSIEIIDEETLNDFITRSTQDPQEVASYLFADHMRMRKNQYKKNQSALQRKMLTKLYYLASELGIGFRTSSS